ncbi:TPA: hypothetical protein ACW0NO_000668 [Enterobacter ludwigii]
MSTITRAFTKEQLIEHIKGRKEFADECAADSTLHPERREYYELTAEALRIALASIEAEKVILYRERNPYNGMTTGWQELTQQEYEFVKDNAGENAEFRAVYTAPPAPVSVPDELTREEYKRRFMEDDNFDDTFRGGWNACRATMLNGGKS